MHAPAPPFFWPIGTGPEPAGQPPPELQVLGHDGATFFVTMPDGSVASVKPLPPAPPGGVAPARSLVSRFVNSTPHHFAGCLAALTARWPRLERTTHTDALVAVGDLRHELNRLDISALGDRDHWWAVFIDHLEDSLP